MIQGLMVFTLPDLAITSQRDAPYITMYGIHVLYTIPRLPPLPTPQRSVIRLATVNGETEFPKIFFEN